MTAARRLAAILAADVVGYSRLMGEDEAGTARVVRTARGDAADRFDANDRFPQSRRPPSQSSTSASRRARPLCARSGHSLMP